MIHAFYTFLFYSFVGFLLEVLYARLIRCSKKDRKCLLFLPLCPVYGLGASLILAMPPLLLRSPVAVFIGGGLLATLAEYSAALFYEWGAGISFWNYSNQPGNLSGRVCPLYTLFWGVLALALVYGVHPYIAMLLSQLPPVWAGPLFFLFAADSVVSLWLLHSTGTTDSLMWYRAFLPTRPETM